MPVLFGLASFPGSVWSLGQGGWGGQDGRGGWGNRRGRVSQGGWVIADQWSGGQGSQGSLER